MTASFVFLASLGWSSSTVRAHHRATKGIPEYSNPRLHGIGLPVSTGPYLGIQTRFDASELLVNLSSINEDLRLLQFRQHEAEAMGPDAQYAFDHPFLHVSGALIGQASAVRQYSGSVATDADIANAELDFVAEINRTVTGYMTVNFDNAATSPIRTSNSRFL